MDASWFQMASEIYCEASHPMETKFLADSVENNKGTCERQHVVQRNRDSLCEGDGRSECDLRTVWWSERRHTYTDRYGYQPFVKDNPDPVAFTQRNALNLRAAYKMGTYGLQWSVIFLDYNDRSNSDLVALQFDGVSNIVYLWSWLVNTPQKFFNITWFGIKESRYDIIIDAAFGFVLFLVVDLPLSIICTIFGVIAGTLLHIPSTVMAIPGGLYLLFATTWSALANFF